MSECTKTFVSPIGRLTRLHFVTCQSADRPPLFGLNHYPRQAIGLTMRLPRGKDISGKVEHYYLSVVWAKPARWWA